MNTEDEWSIRLKAVASPFSASAATNPWYDRVSHVREVNAHIVPGVSKLVSFLKAHPETPVGGMIVGPAGSGKTHILGSLCHDLSSSVAPYSFANIHPLTDPARPLNHLLAEVVTNLIQRPPADSRHSQLERIAARTIAWFLRERYLNDEPERRRQAVDLAEQVERDPSKVLKKASDRSRWMRLCKPIREWIQLRNPRMWSTCLSVFFQYPLEDRRPAVVQWLRGEPLDSRDSKLLGLPAHEEVGSNAALENRARRVLLTLAQLFKYDRPLVVCFDQLENVSDPELLRPFSRTIHDLFDYFPSMMPLACVRPDWWDDHANLIDQPIVERLESNRFVLNPCDRDWATRLVEARLASLDLPEDLPDRFPFHRAPLPSKLEGILSIPDLTPRMVLSRVNGLWIEAVGFNAPDVPSEDPREVIRTQFDRKLVSVRQGFDRIELGDGLLAKAIEIIFKLRVEDADTRVGIAFPGRRGKRYMNLIVHLESGGVIRRTGILVDSSPSAQGVALRFRHGVESLEGGELDCVAFIRDARVEFPDRPRWPATNDLKDELVKFGGRVLLAEQGELELWFTVVQFQQSIRAQDLTCLGADGVSRPLKMEDFTSFLRGIELGPSLESLIDLCRPRTGDSGPVEPVRRATTPLPATSPEHLERICTAAESILRGSPVKMMVAQMVYAAIDSDLRDKVPFKSFLESIVDRPGILRFPSRTDVILKLKVPDR